MKESCVMTPARYFVPVCRAQSLPRILQSGTEPAQPSGGSTMTDAPTHRDPREPTAKTPATNPAAPTRRPEAEPVVPVNPQPEKNQAERERDGETNVTDAPKPETKKQSGSR